MFALSTPPTIQPTMLVNAPRHIPRTGAQPTPRSLLTGVATAQSSARQSGAQIVQINPGENVEHVADRVERETGYRGWLVLSI